MWHTCICITKRSEKGQHWHLLLSNKSHFQDSCSDWKSHGMVYPSQDIHLFHMSWKNSIPLVKQHKCECFTLGWWKANIYLHDRCKSWTWTDTDSIGGRRQIHGDVLALSPTEPTKFVHVGPCPAYHELFRACTCYANQWQRGIVECLGWWYVDLNGSVIQYC